MAAERGRPWLGVAVLVGVSYYLVGTLFALPAAHVQVWRLGAWAVSGLLYAAQLAFEHLGRHASARAAAFHAALAVAIGAFALAVGGAVHSWLATATIRPVWFLALVLWPLITAVPAFLVALAAGLVVTEATRGAPSRS